MEVGAGIAGMVQTGAGVLAGAGAAVGTEVRITEAGTTGMATDITTTTLILTAEEAITPITASEETIIPAEVTLHEATEAITFTTLLQEDQMPTIRLEIRQDTTRQTVHVTAAQLQESTIQREIAAITLQETAATTIIALQHEATTLQEVKTQHLQDPTVLQVLVAAEDLLEAVPTAAAEDLAAVAADEEDNYKKLNDVNAYV